MASHAHKLLLVSSASPDREEEQAVNGKADLRRKMVGMACPAVLLAVRTEANFGLRTLLQILSLPEGFSAQFVHNSA